MKKPNDRPKVTGPDEGDSREAILANLKEAFSEMALIRSGKKKGTPVQEFLDGL
jgi:hypothetical protein